MRLTARDPRTVWIAVAILAVGLAAVWTLSAIFLRDRAVASKPDYATTAFTAKEPAPQRISLDIPAASAEDFRPSFSTAEIWEPYGWELYPFAGGSAVWTAPRPSIVLPALSDEFPRLNDLAKLLPPIELERSGPLAFATDAATPKTVISPVRILLPDASGSGLVGSLPGGLPAAVPTLPSLPALPRR